MPDINRNGICAVKNNDLIQIDIKKIALSSAFCVVVLGDNEREFPIYIEPATGAAIRMFMENIPKVRPLTHDLVGNILDGLDVKVERVVINDLKENTYYARLFLREENELGKKIVEIDCRPSDCMAIAKMKNVKIFVSKKVLDAVGKPPSEPIEST